MTDRAILDNVLNDEFHPVDFDDPVTVRAYLAEFLVALFEQGESFSGKRPFGNSGWENEILVPLVRQGAIKGRIHEYKEEGYGESYEVFDYDNSEAGRVIEELIYHMAGVS